ncbi:MAG: hypothetical protein JW936_00250 [Sedimentisphaerales bacterium]|nr:hypothetical protein [Sedimentisphaerales bacterium]
MQLANDAHNRKTNWHLVLAIIACAALSLVHTAQADLPISQIQIQGLDGAHHFIWIESENAQAMTGYSLNAPFSTTISGSRQSSPYSASCLNGDYDDSYSFDQNAFVVPADMDNATFYTYYASYYLDDRAHVYISIDSALPADLSLPGTGPGGNYASTPVAWSPGVSLGSLTAGGHNITMSTQSTYNEDSYDGFLITDGPCTPGNSVVQDGFAWRAAPYLDPATAGLPGDSVTAAITITGPVDEGCIRVDNTVVQTFSAPGAYNIPITGVGPHTLEVETFAYPYNSSGPLRGRVLAGASFYLGLCGYLDADFNQDCYVNITDLALIAANWLHGTDPIPEIPTPDPAPTPLPTTFPIGWYTSIAPWQAANLSTDGFNCAVPYGVRMGFHSVAYATGLGVIQYISGSGQTLTDFINEYENSPALWYWNLYDEPIGGGNPQSLLDFAANYNTVKAADPDHPVTAVFCMSSIGSYMNYVDFPMFDRYPVNTTDPVPCPSMYLVASETKLMAQQAASAGKGPPIFVAQAFGGLGTWREPTFYEQRYMTFAPITVGARGIIFYSLFDITSAHYLEVVDIAAQLSALIPALESPAGSVSITSNHDSDTTWHGVNDITYDYHTIVENTVSCVYVIAVNNTNSAINNVTLTFTGLPAGTYTADVLHESRSINFIGSTLTDNFAAYDVHIYKCCAN